MTPKTYLVKRDVEKDGLPKKNDFYFTDRGQLFFNEKWKQWEDSNGIEKECDYWYEELPLSSLIDELMPTKEELKKIFPIIGVDADLSFENFLKRVGAREIIKQAKDRLSNK